MHILFADDHPMVRDSMKTWIESRLKCKITIVQDFAEALRQCTEHAFDLVILDLNMPGMEGAKSIKRFRDLHPDAPVLIVSANAHPLAIRACMNAGARGFVSKSGSGEELIDAIIKVRDGRQVAPVEAFTIAMPDLSPRQHDILRLLAEGMSNRDIAEHLGLSEGTIKQYVSEILDKLQVSNRVQASIVARQMMGLS